MDKVIEGQLMRIEEEPAGMIMTTAQAKAELTKLQQFVSSVMVKDIDYGTIPGCGTKPTLLKPGAEKLNEIYGYAPEVDVVEKVEDWKASPAFFNYLVKVSLRNRHGRIVAEGVGSCNSLEVKYKYRFERKWQTEKPGDGWERVTPKDKTKQPFWQLRLINEETAEIANTILKMAKKRALIDATLSATRSSELFTQDIEDMSHGDPADAESHGEDAKQGVKGNTAPICADCGKPVTAVTTNKGKPNQKEYKPSDLVHFSQKDFGLDLCYKCGNIRKYPPKEEQVAQADIIQGEFDNG